MSENHVLELYRNAVLIGTAQSEEELKGAFSKYDSSCAGFYRSDFSPFRGPVIEEFGFGLPTAEMIQIVAERGPILEIGAGSGLWSYFLDRSGCDVVAVDIRNNEIPEEVYNVPIMVGKWHPVLNMDGIEAMERFPERSVLMIWPDRTNDITERVAVALDIGQTLIHLGQLGEYTGTPAFAEMTETAFETLVDKWATTWYKLYDTLSIFQKTQECAIHRTM